MARLHITINFKGCKPYSNTIELEQIDAIEFKLHSQKFFQALLAFETVVDDMIRNSANNKNEG